jgi:hypothetical protein
MWYYKVVIGILLFPWSLILLMVAGSARLRYARKARVIFLPPATLQTAPVLPLTLPEPPAPALSADLDASIPQTS